MNSKKKKILFYSLIGFIIVTTIFTYLHWPRCTVVKTIDASLTIEEGKRKMVGFNTDTDAFKFGKISAGAWVRRSALITYPQEADVTIMAVGDLAKWIEITPDTFHVFPEKGIGVEFYAYAPKTASLGNYTGKVVFCFKE
ncbi:hypothetical protein J4228_04490 [Candidatus Woesearchaeota archaeon]|nr:hypothetical protein [Candidatus Woesearchaeota archaeon]